HPGTLLPIGILVEFLGGTFTGVPLSLAPMKNYSIDLVNFNTGAVVATSQSFSLQVVDPSVPLAISSLAGAASSSSTPGTYADIQWPSAADNRRSEDYFITIKEDPGPTSDVFWSNQFRIGTFGGYTGL